MTSMLRRAVTYTAGGLLSQGVVFLLWLVLPWFMPPAQVGLFALAMFAVELLTTLATLGMDAALIRFAGDGPGRKPILVAAYFNSALVYMAVVMLAALVVFVGPVGWSTILVWVRENFDLVMLVVATNVLWNLFQSGQIAARQAGRYALYQLGRSLLYVAAALAFLRLLAPTASVLIGASAVAYCVMLLLALIREGWSKGGGFQAVLAESGGLRSYGAPLMLYGVLGIAVTYTQRLLVDHYADLTVLGVFAYFNGLIIQINGLWGGLNKAWTPEYFRLVEQDRPKALVLLRGMLATLLIAYPALLALYILLGEMFLNSLFFPAAYLDGIELFYVMLLAPWYTGIYSIAYPLYYHDLKTQRILAISGFLAVVNVAISVLLISTWGASGAAFSFLLLSLLTAWTYLSAYPDWRGGSHLGVALVLATVMGLLSSLALLLYELNQLFSLMLAGSSTLMWLLCKDQALPLFHRLLRPIRRDTASAQR